MLLTFIKYVLFDLLAQSSRPEIRYRPSVRYGSNVDGLDRTI